MPIRLGDLIRVKWLEKINEAHFVEETSMFIWKCCKVIYNKKQKKENLKINRCDDRKNCLKKSIFFNKKTKRWIKTDSKFDA